MAHFVLKDVDADTIVRQYEVVLGAQLVEVNLIEAQRKLYRLSDW